MTDDERAIRDRANQGNSFTAEDVLWVMDYLTR